MKKEKSQKTIYFIKADVYAELPRSFSVNVKGGEYELDLGVVLWYFMFFTWSVEEWTLTVSGGYVEVIPEGAVGVIRLRTVFISHAVRQ